MLKVSTNIEVLEVVGHKTHEIVKIIKPECAKRIITMNITYPLLRSVACDNTEIYFVSSSKDLRLEYNASVVAGNHAKIYETDSRVIISSANLSLSNWLEVSVVFRKTEKIQQFVNEIVKALSIEGKLVRRFW